MLSDLPPSLRGTRPEILILDVDGVLTSNEILLDGEGREWKPFFVPDGTGIRLLQGIGVEVCLLSGRASAVVDHRARELGIERARSGVHAKGPAVREYLADAGVKPANAVYVGDDLIDLAAMKEVGLPVAVANAHPRVKEAARAVTTLAGGAGAVREVCEWILEARNDWDSVLERY